MNEALQAVYDIKLQQAVIDAPTTILAMAIKNISVSKAGSESYTVDGSSRSCKVYSFIIDEEFMDTLIDEVEAEYAEYAEELDLSGEWSSYCNELKDEFDDFPDITATCYIYKGMLACIHLEAEGDVLEVLFEGGATRMENMRVITDNEEILAIEGSTENGVEEMTIKVDDTEVMSVNYDSRSGELYISSPEEGVSMSANVTNSGNDLKIQIENMNSGDSSVDSVSGTLEIKKGADFETFSGEEFDLGSASYDDLTELMSGIESYLY
jgi:hypothetical protein